MLLSVRRALVRFRKRLQGLPPIRNQHPDFVFKNLSYKNYHTFFGYYDRSPWSPNGHRLLVAATTLNDRLVKHDDSLLLVVYDCQQDAFAEVGLSHAWNFQQAAQQQWMSDEQIVYTDVEAGRYVTKVSSISDEKCVEVAPHALAAYHQGRTLGIALDFERLRILEPAYGYPLLGTPADVLAPERFFLTLLHLQDGSCQKLLCLERLAAAFPRQVDPSAYDYWMNHPKFNPQGSRLLFVVRSSLKEKRRSGQRHSDVMVLDLERDTLECVLADEELRSRRANHPVWFDDDRILMNWLVDGETRMVLFKHGTEGYEVIEASVGVSGHPTAGPDRQLLLTDAYPNYDGYRPLWVAGLDSGKVVRLAEFYSPHYFKSHWRCDLHPRWKSDGKEICFDTAHTGKRSLGIATLTRTLLEELS